MSATIELFEQYKQAIGVQADRLAAQELGVKSQTVSNWRTRGSQAEPWLIEKMCLVLERDATPWLLRTLAEQASGAHNRVVWERVAKMLKHRATAMMAVGVSLAWLGQAIEALSDGMAASLPSWTMACRVAQMLASA